LQHLQYWQAGKTAALLFRPCSGDALSAAWLVARAEPRGEQCAAHVEGMLAVGLLAVAAWTAVFACGTSAAVLALVG